MIKNSLGLVVVGLAVVILAPSISLAAPLTQTQAESLIGIVQALPGTPASAFTNLITAFSNITVAQADSLIGVVQAASGVPASAFVNLLVSFTQDTPQTQPTSSNSATTNSNQTSVAQGNQSPSSSATSTPCVSTPIFDFTPILIIEKDGQEPHSLPVGNPIEVPYGSMLQLNGNVLDSCTNKPLSLSKGEFHIDGNINGGTSNDGGQYHFSSRNWGYNFSTTTAYIVISAMGQTATTTFLRLPE